MLTNGPATNQDQNIEQLWIGIEDFFSSAWQELHVFWPVPPRLECILPANSLNPPLQLNSLSWLYTRHFHPTLCINPFAPEPPVTARADPGPFYPL